MVLLRIGGACCFLPKYRRRTCEHLIVSPHKQNGRARQPEPRSFLSGVVGETGGTLPGETLAASANARPRVPNDHKLAAHDTPLHTTSADAKPTITPFSRRHGSLELCRDC